MIWAVPRFSPDWKNVSVISKTHRKSDREGEGGEKNGIGGRPNDIYIFCLMF
jgi:hypothetical protein